MTKSAFIERIILVIFAFTLIFLDAKYVRLSNSGWGPGQINIVVPWGMIAIFISLYLFREYNSAKGLSFRGSEAGGSWGEGLMGLRVAGAGGNGFGGRRGEGGRNSQKAPDGVVTILHFRSNLYTSF